LRLSNVEAFCRVHRLNLPQPAIARSGAYLAISSACETVRCMSAKTGLVDVPAPTATPARHPISFARLRVLPAHSWLTGDPGLLGSPALENP